MVKLEDTDGEALYVNPSLVVLLSASGAEGVTRLCVVNEIEHVKGTPEEVHAKLFPPAPEFGFTTTERNEAILRVLHAVADMRPLDWREVSDSMKADARKALGREGT